MYTKENIKCNTKLLDGDYGNHASILQVYGKEYGGVFTHDINSIFVSSFKDFTQFRVSDLRQIYKTISSLCNMNVLKVLVTLFEYNNYGNHRNGMTIHEIADKTSLSMDEVYEAMNHLDVKCNADSKEERWFIMHTDTLPLLMLLTQGREFFKNGK